MEGMFILCLRCILVISTAQTTNDIETQWTQFLSSLKPDTFIDMSNFTDEMLSLLQKPTISRKFEPMVIHSINDCKNCNIWGLSTVVRQKPGSLSLGDDQLARFQTTVVFRNLTGVCTCEKSFLVSTANFSIFISALNVGASGVLVQQIAAKAPISVAELNIQIPNDIQVNVDTTNPVLQNSKTLFNLFKNAIVDYVHSNFEAALQEAIKAAIEGLTIHSIAQYLTN